MNQNIGYVALVVRDYDEAIDFYVNTLGFELLEDTAVEAQHKRWVLLAPPGIVRGAAAAGSCRGRGAGLACW